MRDPGLAARFRVRSYRNRVILQRLHPSRHLVPDHQAGVWIGIGERLTNSQRSGNKE